MKQLKKYKKDDLIGILYQNQVAHEVAYTFKVFKGEPRKVNLVAMSYIYYIQRERCEKDLKDSMEQIALVDKEF